MRRIPTAWDNMIAVYRTLYWVRDDFDAWEFGHVVYGPRGYFSRVRGAMHPLLEAVVRGEFEIDKVNPEALLLKDGQRMYAVDVMKRSDQYPVEVLDLTRPDALEWSNEGGEFGRSHHPQGGPP